MHFQGFSLCLGLLFISINAEVVDDGVEMEDFDENSEEIDVNSELSSEFNLLCFIFLGRWEIEGLKENRIPGDRGLVLKSRAKHHAISAVLAKPFIFADKPLIVQYEVNFQDGIDCGGAYIKLLADTDGLILENFYDKTSYTIMFGPDKCGEEYKLHFIFRHKHPITGVFEEKHAKPPDVDLKTFFTDRKTHLYTLVMNPDDTFEVLIDQIVVNKGNLLNDVVPPVNPPKEIDDPDDRKPDEWDERAKIPDSSAVKPEDWDENEPAEIEDLSVVKPDGWLDDEPKFIPDPNAVKPDDWNEDMDGEWEAPLISNPACKIGCGEWKPPMIDNPKYKGIWRPPMIDNPNYQGIWSPRKIPNPDYFEDDHPFLLTSFCALGLELWSMTSNIYFDNFIICSEKEVADRWAADGWRWKIMVASANEPFAKTFLASENVEDEMEEEEGEPEEKSEEEIEITEGQEEGNKSNKSGSEDEMKEADESTGSGDGPVKSVRKRRVRKD
ncbi:PREDICTED: calmegin [Propithecus coquereli]|uniref:calmegin n=1 Tax=Propithecus coquereli TaxID=379532 RepID=UPI00063FA814|nr:PREDICTED: calmegin [Propithecus coquereli]